MCTRDSKRSTRAKDGGAQWSTVGPYWNFDFPCWSIDPAQQTGNCNQTTHSDQHGVAIGRYHGKSYVYVGNDGGAYKRPLNGSQDAAGHATDWTSLNDGTIDTLQYYSVGVGKDPASTAVSRSRAACRTTVSPILRSNDKVMGSNFGGDGTDTITDPGQRLQHRSGLRLPADPGHPELRRQRRFLGRTTRAQITSLLGRTAGQRRPLRPASSPR